jgi:2-polyprenyl-3-methyl-5-hydroxy-6-metoxy-1,4-benzoquinol methylase
MTPIPEERALRLYSDIPLMSRMYLWIRLRNFPKRQMWPVLLGLSGRVVSIGAGYGIFETLTALANPRVRFVASDVNTTRIRVASQATASVPNIQFEVLDLTQELPKEQADAFLLLDVLHHLAPPFQLNVLRKLSEHLPSGGRIIIKECGIKPAWKCWVNYLNDAIGSPFQRTYPRGEEEWARILGECGLSTTVSRLDHGSPYAHILVIGAKA